MVRNTMNRSKRVNRIMREHGHGLMVKSGQELKEMLTQMYNEAFEDGYEQREADAVSDEFRERAQY